MGEDGGGKEMGLEIQAEARKSAECKLRNKTILPRASHFTEVI